MSERISVVIYYDGEVRHTENGVVFLSENTTRLAKNLRNDANDSLSIKYRFCASVDLVTYDSFDIKGAHGLESISDAGITYWGTSTSTSWQATSDWGRYETSRRRNDALPTTSTGEGTSYVAADDGSDNESDVDPPREPGPDGAEVALFSELEPVPIEPEGGSDAEEEDPQFRAYSPPTHMHNVDLSGDDALEFLDLPHRLRDRASSLLDSSELQVGKEFSNKDSFLGALKQHSIMNGVNYNMGCGR
ncbi:hypothetical protein J1N35_043777 [Gossypium stocksii]|uniref:Uncharacterized protein n=1 Tax=Gossypium stocksii TaxID=47602 RepID=A0A9D3U7Y6_9ROSI|nr:hypothetical protein J1N35_043777 [Gossypium stocksii]